jgi:hypothetical protein
MGDRTVDADGNMVFEDLTNNYKAMVVFNTYKKSGFWTVTETGKKDEYVGIIYKSKPIDLEESFRNNYSKDRVTISDLSYVTDIEKEIT